MYIDCVITKAVAVYVSGGYYTMIHRYDIPEVVYYQLLYYFWRSGLLKTDHHGEKIVLVKFEREIERIPVYEFCTAKTYEKSFRPFVRTNSVFLTRAVRKNVRQMSDRQSPSHHIPTSSYVELLFICSDSTKSKRLFRWPSTRLWRDCKRTDRKTFPLSC